MIKGAADLYESAGDEPVCNDGSGLHEHGIHVLSGFINYDVAYDVITWVLAHSLPRRPLFEHLTLIINSPGGDLHCAFAMIDVMRGASLPIHTVGLGQVSSCGLLVFLAGTQGHRVLTPNTSIMSHVWAGSTHGKAHELLSAQREHDLTTQRMLAHYRHCTGLDEAVIKQKLLPAHDVFLTAEEALALNICDQIRHLS